MNPQLTRKEFLRTGTKVAAGFAVGATVLGVMDQKSFGSPAQLPPWPWTYPTIDVEQARINGHDAYWSGKGCCYGAFHGLFQTLRDAVGEPFTTFPDEIMVFGAGGGVGWGGTCGAIVGASAAISVLSEKAVSDKLVNELFGWYTLTELPTATSNQLAVEQKYGVNKINDVLPQNIAHSPLCHASVTMWCEHASKKVSDLDRKERCARVTGDCAAYAAKLLNDQLLSQFNPLYTTPAGVTACNACHGAALLDNVASKMECASCHGDPHATSGVRQTGELALNYKLSSNYPNPFNPSTKLEFSLPQGENVFLQIFDGHGRLVSTIVNGTRMNPGTYEFDWNANTDVTTPLSSGTYYARIVAGKFIQTQKMILSK